MKYEEKQFLKEYKKHLDRKDKKRIQGVLLFSMFTLSLLISQLISYALNAPIISVGFFIASFVFLYAYLKILVEHQ